jgi:hypothetical protein
MPQGDWWRRGPESYWRRRIFVFAGVLGVLGLLAWACSAMGSVPRSPGQAAGATTSVGATPTAAPQAAARATPTAAPQAAAGATPTATRTGRVTARPTPTRHAATSADVAHRASDVCAPGDVVISLHESRQSYPQPADPQFTIYVVNAGGRTCSFDVGPRSLRLVVRSGPVHQWSPADCAHGATSDMARLPRGVPLVKHVSWNRERSDPGCPAPEASALPGTYTATATDGAQHSQTQVFLLRQRPDPAAW